MISQLSAKYQFCAIHSHTADTTDGKVTTRAPLSIESQKAHRLYVPVHGYVTMQTGVNYIIDVIKKGMRGWAGTLYGSKIDNMYREEWKPRE